MSSTYMLTFFCYSFCTGRVAPVQSTQSRNAASVAPNAKDCK